MLDNIPTQFPMNMANLVIPESFEDCLSYEEQIMFLYSKLQAMGYEVRYEEDGGQPDVEFVEEYVEDELTGIFIFKNLKGDKGDKGEPGDAQYPDITASATVSNTTGTPSCSVVRTGTASNPIYTFHFVNVKGEQGEKGDEGEQGEKGDTGSTPDISMTASVSNTSGTPSVVVTKDDTDPDNVSFSLAFSGLKGVQGDKGDKGDKGDTGSPGATGATPNIQMSATADATSSVTPTVTITKGGTDENPTFALAFSGLKGAKGDAGGPGSAPDLTATASVDNTSGTPDVVVTKSGTSLEPNFDFAFTGLKGADGADGTDGVSPVVNVTSITGGHNIEIVSAGGTTDFDVMDGEQGEQGAPGQDGQDGVTPSISATATVDSNVGTPAVNVVKTGTDASPNFAFNFSNIKGSKGDTGATPVISASATVDANVGTPAVSVTKSGTDAAPSFAFAFSNIKGQQGVPGQDGADGEGVPTGGTTGQVLSKHSGTDYDTEWRDVSEVPDTTGANNGDVLTKAVSGPTWAAPVKELPVYTAGDAGEVLKVNSGGTGVEWGEETKELPSYNSGDAGKALKVNSAGTGVEWGQGGGGVDHSLKIITISNANLASRAMFKNSSIDMHSILGDGGTFLMCVYITCGSTYYTFDIVCYFERLYDEEYSNYYWVYSFPPYSAQRTTQETVSLLAHRWVGVKKHSSTVTPCYIQDFNVFDDSISLHISELPDSDCTGKILLRKIA